MSWDRDPLWAKSRLLFQRAFEHSHDDPLFGLWCSLAVELLARAAVASVSPTLLAEPDQHHKHLLHALGRGTDPKSRKSLDIVRVFALCRTLFSEDFSEEDFTAVTALVNRRNEELHTGAAAFEAYPSDKWLSGFYRACLSLVKILGESLENLFGQDEARVAEEMLKEVQKEVKQSVRARINSYGQVFADKPEDMRNSLINEAKKQADAAAFQRHHRVNCPACGCVAVVQGETYGQVRVRAIEGEIETKQPVKPRNFACSACGLKLYGYGELDAAGIGGHYTRTTRVSPEEFYGLVDMDTLDQMELLEKYIEDDVLTEFLQDRYGEYDNE
jgi:hypothetical protein